jgi:hypothetical protein
MIPLKRDCVILHCLGRTLGDELGFAGDESVLAILLPPPFPSNLISFSERIAGMKGIIVDVMGIPDLIARPGSTVFALALALNPEGLHGNDVRLT